MALGEARPELNPKDLKKGSGSPGEADEKHAQHGKKYPEDRISSYPSGENTHGLYLQIRNIKLKPSPLR